MNVPATDPRDPLHMSSDPGLHWTTVNLGEAIPGVLTPLCWSLWDGAVNQGMREAVFDLGILTPAERQELVSLQIFYGRVAFAVEVIAMIGDRMPGTTGKEAVESVFANASGLAFSPTRGRYPWVAWRLPSNFLRIPRQLQTFAAEQTRWWTDAVQTVDSLSLDQARCLLIEARQRHEAAVVMQCRSVIVCTQPVYAALARLVDHVGAGDLSTLSAAPGGVEMGVVADIWRASREEIGIEEVVRRHGFHGPLEGEVSSRSWREDEAPLRKIIGHYAALSGDEDPTRQAAERRRARPGLEREFLDSASASIRPLARLVLRLVRDILPLRGVAKRSLLQSMDVARAAARRVGHHLCLQGLLAAPDDVFYLTVDEIAGDLPADLSGLVTFRRERRQRYLELDLPKVWTGEAPAVDKVTTTTAAVDAAVVTGVGVSSGSVEGIARVVTTPDFLEVEPDEVLVAPTTDPSWAAIMFVSKALVVDIGGALSHAAVVARELGIPCVVNTVSGTTTIRTGDRVRVDGTAGTVEILEPAKGVAH
jgi:pyruvate,water dikinase